MKNWFLFFVLSLVLTSVACSRKSETDLAPAPTSTSAPENQEKKQGLFEETGKKMDQGIQKTGDKIDQGLNKAGEGIQKGLNQAGEKVKDATQ